MFDGSIISVQDFLAQQGLPAVFLLGFFEEILFFIPSSFVFIALGFFIIDPQATLGPALGAAFWHISLLTSLGVTAGALCVYGLVYWGGKPFVERYGKYARVSWKDFERFERWFEQGYADEAILIFFRAIPIFPITIVSAFCGLIRTSPWEFAWTTFIGTIPRIVGLALVGWYVGKEYEQYAAQIAGIEPYGLILFIVLAAACVWYFHSFRRST